MESSSSVSSIMLQPGYDRVNIDGQVITTHVLPLWAVAMMVIGVIVAIVASYKLNK